MQGEGYIQYPLWGRGPTPTMKMGRGLGAGIAPQPCGQGSDGGEPASCGHCGPHSGHTARVCGTHAHIYTRVIIYIGYSGGCRAPRYPLLVLLNC